MKNYKNLVKAIIEINGVDYLIDEFAAKMIEKDAEDVILIRLFDRDILVISAKEIKEIIKNNGIADRLD